MVMQTELPADRSRAIASDGARTFVTLDGLRGIAALAVAARHAPFQWRFAFPGALYESYLAVDFFFVLSGFVLAYAYGDRLRDGMSTRQFMATRLIRLYPLYLLALIFSLTLTAIQLLFGKGGDARIFLNAPFAFLFMPSPFNAAELFPINFPAWSLFFELVANFAFALLAARLSTRSLVAIVSAAALTLLLAVSCGWLGFGTGHGAMDAGPVWRSFGAGFVRVGYSFFAGVLAFRIWQYRPLGARVPSLVTIVILCMILLAWPPFKLQAAFDLLATLLVFPALVLLGANCTPTARMVRWFTWLGSVSYGVYVLQVPLYPFIERRLAKVHVGVSWLQGAACFALVVAVAAIADEYFDRPVRRALTRRLGARHSLTLPRQHDV